MARPTQPQIWSAVQSAIQTAAGCTAIWKYQDAAQPSLDYVAMSLGSEATVDVDYVVESPVAAWEASTAYGAGDRVIHDSGKTYSCAVAGTSGSSGGPTGTGSAIVDGTARWSYVAPGGEVQLTLGGVREVALQLEVFSAATVEETARQTALSRCSQIVARLRMPTARDALKAVAFVPFDPGPVQWLPSIVAAGFRGRATCDIRCRMPAEALREFVGYIAALDGTTTVHAGGADVSAPFSAP